MGVSALLIQRPLPAEMLDLLGTERSAQLERALLQRGLEWGRAFAPRHTYHASCEAAGELAAAAARAFECSSGGPLLVASTACASLTWEHSAAALSDAAHGLDLSIGPASDGGWYLLALGQPNPDVLAAAGVELGQGLLAFHQAGLEIGLLRSERELSSVAAARAISCDPIAPPEIREILRVRR
ncbi:MAG: DUF2064 domain-containing protein [Solirubrobacteraceae bacterium]